MHVPFGIALDAWIYDLMSHGRLYAFYKTDEWKNLRNAVMEEHHWECERCAELGAWKIGDDGRISRSDTDYYTKAVTVHHDFEVRRYPSMALTRYVTEPDGAQREVLHPLCTCCHNEIHGRLLKGAGPRPQLNDERWD